MLRLCSCLIAVWLVGCQCPLPEKKHMTKEVSTLAEIPAKVGTEAVSSVVQQKPLLETTIQWVSSFDDGLRMAKARNCSLMVDFSAEWCGWCKKLDEDTWTNKDVILLAQKFVCVKIDCDTDRQTPARYGAKSLPTILFMNTDGKVIHQVLGYRNAEDMTVEMNAAGKR
ncbi:MAG: thioredoxin family protein [bacterium]